MEFKFIDKSFYADIAPKMEELWEFHSVRYPERLAEAKPVKKRDFNKRVKRRGFLGVAVYEDGRLCGFCLCRIADMFARGKRKLKHFWIDEFFICEEFRHNGYGTKLFRYVEALAKEKGCERIELNVWNFNEAAFRFYDSLGFKNQSTVKEYIL